ncbi:hypothetical protein FA95DRAFT_1494754 [Auriscalpium vulgare]|uniref:Uncharacterized protein n=1 Tax=Auriscalpium vulgare TaxID=40419 RepID=A0ACB8RPZ3_9AGAM|nr:hypothetical protein FA95DRAFT_1494754 [Auriscalpium vulgare]
MPFSARSISTLSPQCNSESELQHELASIRPSLSLTETEETWDKIANGFLRLSALCKGGACDYPTALTPALRSLARPLTSAVSSERTRLSAAALDVITTSATGLGTSFEPLMPLLLPTLLSLCSRPNKVVIARTKAAIQVIVEQTQLPSILPHLTQALGDKSATLRMIAIESVLACLNCLNPPDLEKEVRAKEIEGAIRSTVTDASGDVRKVSRQVFDAYKILLPDRIDRYVLAPAGVVLANLNSFMAVSLAPCLRLRRNI